MKDGTTLKEGRQIPCAKQKGLKRNSAILWVAEVCVMMDKEIGKVSWGQIRVPGMPSPGVYFSSCRQ